jgi:DNA replication protein DnaC
MDIHLQSTLLDDFCPCTSLFIHPINNESFDYEVTDQWQQLIAHILSSSLMLEIQSEYEAKGYWKFLLKQSFEI